ncbi:MAG: biopolymer transporter ExbD [Methanobacteriaceae archaeon]|jgi:biopolymer transport protein ExbD|nr:biopolymer transporter ExbD [Methanobacteriaceae archaeon]
MLRDIKSHKKKIAEQKPNFNLVPFIDIIFTLLIFLVLTSNFGDVNSDVGAIDNGTGTGKPNVTDTSGNNEYFIVPVHNLEKVTVDGQDMSHLIKNDAIGIQAKVIDEGEVNTKKGQIDIITPSGISPNEAVKTPQ